jgi:HSP20 family protein
MAITPYRASTDLFRPFFEDFLPGLNEGGSRLSGMLRTPAADVVENENEIRVMIEAPGMRAEDIGIDLENNVLTISGEKREKHDESDDRSTWHLSERRYGRFSRSFVLPRDVEQERIEATFENGVLHVIVPKSERARRRRIEVRNGAGEGQQRVETSAGGAAE